MAFQISDNGRYLQTDDGLPLYLHADTVWSLPSQYAPHEVTRYLDTVARQGFNTVQFSAVFPKRGEPLLKEAFDDQDLTRPKALYWANVDWVVGQATERGLIALVNPFWKKGLDDILSANGPEKCREFGRWFARRYIDDPQVIFFLGGDSGPEPVTDELVAVAEGIQEVYKGRAVITYHNSSDHSSLDAFPDRPAWLKLNWTYAYSPAYRQQFPYEQNHAAYAAERALPIFFGEGYYDLGRRLRTPVSDRWANRYALRRQAWWAGFLTGSTGYAYGAEPVWRHQHEQTTWQAALRFESRQDMQPFRQLCEALPWWTLRPDLEQSWLSGGYGTPGRDDFAVAALSTDRRLAVLYTPVQHELQLDLRALAAGALQAYWYDPSSGTRDPVALPQDDVVTLQSPEANTAGDPDFVLVVQSMVP